MAQDYSRCYLLIAIPTVDQIPWGFAKCLNELTRRLDELGVNYDVYWEAGSLIYLARDNIVTKAIGRQDTHILWLDSDMIFGKDLFERLYATMNEHQAPLTTGIYNSRHMGQKPVIFKQLALEVRRLQEYPEEEVFEIEGCGFGCCLTRVDMMADIWDHEGTCFRPTADFGEDLAFCRRAMEIRGYKMVADQGACCGHISNRIVWPDDRAGDMEMLNK